MSEVKKRDLPMVPFPLLTVKDGFNIRTDMGDIPGLAASIKENGVKVPLRGYKEKGAENYIVVDGHRRYEALKILAAESSEIIYVPFVLEPQKYNDEQRVVDMFIMNDGKSLTPLEQAEGIKRLQNWGYSDKDIAQKTGRSIAYVGKLASLNSAPKRLINLIENNKIAASFAMDIICKGETEKFLQDFEAGFFDAKPVNGNEIFPDQPATKTKTKITKADIQPVNSWKEFKRFAKDADPKLMEDGKAKFFKFLYRVMNNEMSEEQIKRWFK
jgi:ParB/RepB/Spo0J family partition protein